MGLLLTITTVFLGGTVLAWGLGGLTLFVTFFFRNPPRTTPAEEGLIISPADGKICQIEENVLEPRFLKAPRKRVSIFMSVFNCHVNRAPISGQVKNSHYNPGKFHMASVDKASELNEQHALLLEDDRKNQLVVVQIAGWVARRIVNYLKIGDKIQKGTPYGIIQFGSRVDLYLPLQCQLRVRKGEFVRGGETVIGTLS